MGDRRRIQKRLERARYRFGWGDPEQDEKSLAKAAEFFGLDPNKPSERDRLLYKLAEVAFGPDGKKGRPWGSRTSWGRRLITLGMIYDKKKLENPKLSDAKIARMIADEFAEFRHVDVEQIRQRLKMASKEYSMWLEKHQDDNYSEPDEEYDGSDD
jgi:hypothetical protein